MLEVDRPGDRRRAGPGRRRDHRPGDRPRCPARPQPPPFDLYRPDVTASLPTILDHAPATLRHPRLQAAFEVSAASVAGFRAVTATGSASPRSTRPKIVALGDRVRRQRRSASTTSAAGPTWPSRRSSTSRRMVGVFERVYEVGPVFRAEPHDTARHLAQYTSLDAEFGFITDHRDVMAVLREVLAGMVAGGARPGRRGGGAARRRPARGARARSRRCTSPTRRS